MKTSIVLLATFTILLSANFGVALSPTPPETYVSASDILPLPEFIPGAGSLYIDPANAPIGPWLAYGKDGTLIELLYMVPLSQMEASQNWEGLSAGVLEQLGASVDHVDITFNGGHPGMAEPHYHIRLVLVSDEEQQVALAE